MEGAKLARHIQELHLTIEAALLKYVPLDRFFKLMDAALSAIHTLERTLREKSVFLTTAMTERNSDQTELALSAQNSRELKEEDSLVDMTHVTSDKRSSQMAPVNTVSYTMLFPATEDSAFNLLASQW